MSGQHADSRPLPRRFDPFLDDGAIRATWRALVSGQWDDFLSGLSRDPTGWLASSIITSDDAAVETAVFQRLVNARPSALTLTLLGAAKARDAWNLVRGHQLLDSVPDDVRSLLGIQLSVAEQVLQEAIQVRAELVEPWVHLLTTGRGRGLDLRVLRSRFEAVHSRAPFRPDAAHAYLLALGTRHGGNDGAMFDFAHWVQAEAPPGSPALVALPAAHIEYGLGTAAVSMSDHLRRPGTVAEVSRALAAFLRAIPDPAEPAQLLTLNTFALAMTVDDRETAKLTRECFRRIDNRPTSYPWVLYEEDIAGVFAEIQQAQLRNATRFELS